MAEDVQLLSSNVRSQEWVVQLVQGIRNRFLGMRNVPQYKGNIRKTSCTYGVSIHVDSFRNTHKNLPGKAVIIFHSVVRSYLWLEHWLTMEVHGRHVHA